jgi:hypothetical protein
MRFWLVWLWLRRIFFWLRFGPRFGRFFVWLRVTWEVAGQVSREDSLADSRVPGPKRVRFSESSRSGQEDLHRQNCLDDYAHTRRCAVLPAPLLCPCVSSCWAHPRTNRSAARIGFRRHSSKGTLSAAIPLPSRSGIFDSSRLATGRL